MYGDSKMKNLFIIVFLLLTSCGGGGGSPIPPAPAPAPIPSPSQWAVTNGTLTVTASADFGASVVSVTDQNGNQYTNATDHGREFQSAYQLDGQGEHENPTEAGSAADGSHGSSSTAILNAQIMAPNVFTSSVHAAYWDLYNGAIVSPDTMTKTITVGYNGLTNVIRWDVALNIVSAHTTGAFEGLTGYGPQFPNVYVQQFDGSFTLTPEAPNQEINYTSPIIESSADSLQAVGLYSPGYYYVNNVNIENVGVDKWDCAWWAQTPLPAGTYDYTCYVVIGTLASVEASLVALEEMIPSKAMLMRRVPNNAHPIFHKTRR